MGATDLIKTVRGLDQSGPGERGENLSHLWELLTASSGSNFHAAEESCLRWLLKSMNGSTSAAETLRRYPLTWKLLGCVFQRIPLFSLAKSLADRRFLTTLQQSLKEVSATCSETSSAQSSKRKRSPPASFALEDLKSVEGRIESIQAIFEALGCLLQRTDQSTLVSAHDKIGAEHLKSLFATPVTEATTVTASLLLMCNLVLESGQCAEIEDCEGWVATTSSVWGLHLQDSNDAGEFAATVFTPAATLLASLEDLVSHELPISNTLRTRWSKDLQNFMHKTLVLPARSKFLDFQNDQAIVVALEVAERRIDAAAPTLYFLASTVTDLMAEHGVRKGNAEWMKRVFQVVMKSMKGHADRAAIMKNILDQARQRSMAVSIDDLRLVYREYAVKQDDDKIDWDLVANLSQCDPDVFQGGDEGSELLADVCAKSLGNQLSEQESAAVSQVIGSIIRGFQTSREFPSFLKLWFKQLSEVERRKLKSSPWLSVGREENSTDLGNTWIERELSEHQLVNIMDWVEAQETRPKALSLWLNAVSQGIQSENFKDAIGEKTFGLTLKIGKSNSDITALKWRIVAKAFSWVPLSKSIEIWGEIVGPLSKILKKSSIDTPETFEAFKCCCRIWVSMSPDGAHTAEAAKLVEAFTTRLAAEAASAGVADDTKLPLHLGLETEPEFREDSALQQYLAWYLRGSTRLTRLYFEKKGELSPAIQNVVSDKKANPQGLHAVWQSLFNNEHCLNETKLAENLVDRAIDVLDESKKQKHWPDEHGQMWLQLISAVPLDAITRQQRERIMNLLMGACTSAKSTKKASTQVWNTILSVGTKLMARPTFYDGMAFQHLVDIAEVVSQAFTVSTRDNEALEELIGRYSLMASATIKQMAEHVDERSISYFSNGSAFVSRCKAANKAGDAQNIAPLHLTLLKALVQGLSESVNGRNHTELNSLASDVGVALGQCMASFFGEWLDDKKLFSKSNVVADFRLFAAVDVSDTSSDNQGLQGLKVSSLRKLEQRSLGAMKSGDLRGWKMQTFLQRHFASELEVPRPANFHSIASLQSKAKASSLREYVGSIIKTMNAATKMQYLEALISERHVGWDTDGQLIAIQHVVDQLIDSTELQEKGLEFDLSAAHSEMTRALVLSKTTANSARVCHILYSLLEKKPQSISQWNIESLLGAVAASSAEKTRKDSAAPFAWLCKLIEVIVKKHRLRLEGHYHVLLTALQPLLRNLIQEQQEAQSGDGISQESKASAYGRLVTLVCEPTAGAVSRSQHHSALDTATDAAKRSAGRHMYLILIQYVKLQLETDVSRAVREALEPAMNSIFDITPPEGRKILNDAMDASGRTILREMFKRYTRFGKWSGV